MSVLDVFRVHRRGGGPGVCAPRARRGAGAGDERQVQGAPLFDLQMVQGHVADMALDVDAAALLVYRAAWAKDQVRARVTREAAMAKLFATDHAQMVIDKAVQLFGGDGVRHGHRGRERSTARSVRCASTRAPRTCSGWSLRGRRLPRSGRTDDAEPSAHIDTFARDNLPAGTAGRICCSTGSTIPNG